MASGYRSAIRCLTGLAPRRLRASMPNVRSLAVMERLGFAREGVLRQLDYYKGAYHDDVVYSMLREEWTGRR